MLWLILAHLIRAQLHSTTEATMDIILVTDTSTRADIEEAMAHIVATIHHPPDAQPLDRPACVTTRQARRHARGLGTSRALSDYDRWRCEWCGYTHPVATMVTWHKDWKCEAKP